MIYPTETGMAGNDKFSSSGNGLINITGGYVYVDASGDGIDANGNIKMAGGTVLVNGPTNDGNGSLGARRFQEEVAHNY